MVKMENSVMYVLLQLKKNKLIYSSIIKKQITKYV